MKNLNILLLIILAFGIQSCSDDYLSPTPVSAVSAEGYFTTERELESGVINMYDGLQGINSTASNQNHSTQVEFYVTEMRSDNTRTKSSEGEPEQFENFTIESTNGIVGDYYRSVYNTIYRANIVLENVGVASAEKAGAFEGEAKFVRALSYFNLVRLFGDIPLVTSVIGPEDTDIQFTRVSTDEVYSLIVSDLETASANLDNSYITRASKAAAQGLLAKVHLTLGNYAEAKTLCEAVMDSGYELEANF